MKRLFILPFLVILISACSHTDNQLPITYAGYTQGTTFSIIIYGDGDQLELQRGIDSLLFVINKTASVYDSNSIISRFNNNEQVVFNDHFNYLVNRSQQIAETTDGAFDITVGPLVKAWGFRRKQGLLLDENQVDSLMTFTGFRKLEIIDDEIRKINPKVQIDFNAVAQGYTVDVLASFLEQHNLHNFLIDVGGEVKASGTKPGEELWRVAIEKPAEDGNAAQAIQQTLSITNKSIATSGNYRNYFIHEGNKYAHTIDPKTGYPARHSLLSVTVIADDCASADAYATAFMVMGFERTITFQGEHPGMDVYLIFSQPDGTLDVKFSNGFRKYLNLQ